MQKLSRVPYVEFTQILPIDREVAPRNTGSFDSDSRAKLLLNSMKEIPSHAIKSLVQCIDTSVLNMYLHIHLHSAPQRIKGPDRDDTRNLTSWLSSYQR